MNSTKTLKKNLKIKKNILKQKNKTVIGIRIKRQTGPVIKHKLDWSRGYQSVTLYSCKLYLSIIDCESKVSL